MAKVKDFVPNPFPELSWASGDVLASLEQLHNYVETEVKKFIEWYYYKRKSKRFLGFGLRIFAIVFTAVAGVLPVLADIFGKDGVPFIKPSWATFGLAIAALLILLDKFGGYTSGWVRYMMTGQELSQMLEGFHFEWLSTKLAFQSQTPTPEQVIAAASQCKDFMMQAHGVIREETKLWAAEFQDVLKDIEKSVKTAEKLKQLGAVSVEVPNGDQC